MKRIPQILVLLVVVLLVSVPVMVAAAQAGDGDYLTVPDSTVKADNSDCGTYAAPPDGDGSEGDPDSMGDGLSRDLVNPVGEGAGASWSGAADSFPGMAEYLLYVLSQIQVLII